jgi:hypothetical protein
MLHALPRLYANSDKGQQRPRSETILWLPALAPSSFQTGHTRIEALLARARRRVPTQQRQFIVSVFVSFAASWRTDVAQSCTQDNLQLSGPDY